MIPGLEKAVFARLGGLHRNTFLNSPRLLDASLRLKAAPRLRFAGQVTGVEGYVEAPPVGLLAGRLRRRPSGWAEMSSSRRRRPRWAPWSATSPAAIWTPARARSSR
jgi:folate-dependent tRNA-U54 methylase TrmFO/GidA